MINDIGVEQLLRGWGNWGAEKLTRGFPGKTNFHTGAGSSRFQLSDFAAAAVDAVVTDLKGYNEDWHRAVVACYVQKLTGRKAADCCGVGATVYRDHLRQGVAFCAGRLWAEVTD